MNQISLLSQDTIDKIAAGEVVERPSSIVKELVENAVDAGANAVTVEIKDGGISLIRITDNGSGIPKDQVQVAFLRHATSKIRTVDDLLTSGTLGFRGEALSSIAAVCQVELITKTAGSLTGVRYTIEGGIEKSLEEIGAPEGTTFLVRNLFYHTPARKKFLKSATTEAGYVSDLMERMALSHPEISFKFINNRDTKLHTSGNSSLKDVIYGIYGREIAANVVKIDAGTEKLKITGFIGKPVISRGNRNYENYFVNGRYVKSAIIAKAIEDAYKPFMMNHRYPFTVLKLDIDTTMVDVNVHPTKMEVRFANQSEVYDQVYQAVKEGLLARELIPEFTIDSKPPVKPQMQGRAGMVQTRVEMPQGRTGMQARTEIQQGSAGMPLPGLEISQSRGEALQGRIGTQPRPEISQSGSGMQPRPEGQHGYTGVQERLATLQERTESSKICSEVQRTETGVPQAGADTHLKTEMGNTGMVQSSAENPQSQPEILQTSHETPVEPFVITQEKKPSRERISYPEPFEKVRSQLLAEAKSPYEIKYPERNRRTGVMKPVTGNVGFGTREATVSETKVSDSEAGAAADRSTAEQMEKQPSAEQTPVQMELFEHRLLTKESRKQHKLIGQVFDTYWLVEFEEKLYIIDQHAAHEKVLYERFMKSYEKKEQTSQMITPPLIVSLTMQEETMLKQHMDHFHSVGFEIEHFGGKEYSIRAVPGNLYGIADKTLFLELLDGLTDVSERAGAEAICEKIASMSCKAAVKGNQKLSAAEADALIEELLGLENPYNCPHGRPTIISMTKYEMEKKFKRVL